MGEKKQDVFALVFASGRAETIVGGGMGSGPLHEYWQVLDRIQMVSSTSGFAHDWPTKLLRNGEPVDGLPIDLAWEYHRTLQNGRDHAMTMARAAHWPEWMEGEPDVR